MIVQLITAIALSVVMILMFWAAFRTFKKPMPRTLIPLVIGATAISYGIYSEYTWESRTLEKMPDSIEVVHRFSGTSAFSPWSYVIPRTDRVSLVDTAMIRRNPDLPDYAMLDLLFLQRFSPVARARQMLDCRGAKRADLVGEPEFNEQGLPVNLNWEQLTPEHRLVEIVCN